MIRTDWGPLLMYYIVIFVISVALQIIDPVLIKAWLGANLVFLGFIVWMERPFIPVVRKNHYLALLVSTLSIFLGLVLVVK